MVPCQIVVGWESRSADSLDQFSRMSTKTSGLNSCGSTNDISVRGSVMAIQKSPFRSSLSIGPGYTALQNKGAPPNTLANNLQPISGSNSYNLCSEFDRNVGCQDSLSLLATAKLHASSDKSSLSDEVNSVSQRCLGVDEEMLVNSHQLAFTTAIQLTRRLRNAGYACIILEQAGSVSE
ncbi:unnamed protein product [Protopolystoma xenopodis]|uniref:Uncharacterized protein n=1 Tax=Protopolystoma xenopodis TaxID=117903 RepID=A0A448WY14_9PLAT|nr:unnamed protein product [Protopolystoma xenopodis]